MAKSIEERFWAKVDKTDSCWIWTASTQNKGYGQFNAGQNRITRAHVFAYRQLVGPIPAGLELDHKCKNRRCVRPDSEHVRPVTHQQNIQGSAGRPSISGARGVYPAYGRSGRREGWWIAQVNGNHIGTFDSIEKAAGAARLARLQMFTHSDGR